MVWIGDQVYSSGLCEPLYIWFERNVEIAVANGRARAVANVRHAGVDARLPVCN